MSALRRANPVSLVAAALIATTPLLASLDPVSGAVATALDVVLLVAGGVGPLRLARRCLPLLVAAPIAAVSMALYGQPAGREYLHAGLIRVTDGSLALALATALRVLALGVPAVGLFSLIDPTRLADGLAQNVRLPARFVLGTLAGTRTIGLVSEDWRLLGLARRARGLGDADLLRRLATMSFGLLVIALRRGTRLATAMEARGFGRGARTWARPARLGAIDAMIVLAAMVVPVLALGSAAVAGTLHTLWW